MKAVRIAALLTLILPCAANAQDCKPLTLVGTAQMEREHGLVLVQATVNDQPTYMIVDTGAWRQHLNSDFVGKLGLERIKTGRGSVDETGHTSDEMVRPSTFKFGTFTSKNTPFTVMPHDIDDKYGIGGLIGENFLTHFDVEFDFADNKFKFMSQDHCEGRVVYWHPSVLAVVPFRRGSDNSIVIPVTLDGVQMNAIVDTGSDVSTITMPAAQRYFGLTKDSPGMEKTGPINDVSTDIGYKYLFKTLSFKGVTISNPTLVLEPDLIRVHLDESPPTGTRINTDSDLIHPPVILGIEELQHLHLYIAYKEKRLFISPAETPAPAVASGAPAP